MIIATLVSGLIQPALARTLEVEVYGMTCAFCVDSLQRSFNKNEDVVKVDVSLEQKKVRLETKGNLPSVETIRQMVLDAGFTPIKVTELPDGGD
jgi:copper chaperone CopZ